MKGTKTCLEQNMQTHKKSKLRSYLAILRKKSLNCEMLTQNCDIKAKLGIAVHKARNLL